ncbi:flagellar hook assembly protein FlgD [Prosthecomicrobium sp. N25]|uniref:flagellar hook assembly protein FlgD n=1 Tax=Prosthecomicrobium sp. N25 TaxID=3129254 RepID=UPI0030788DD0
MALSGVTSVPGQTSTAKTDQSKLTSNYETFLTLLTTQLKNQSPLEPMDANQFTQQLVQFSSIEQQIKMNANLEEMKTALAVSNATALVNYVGTTVTVDSGQTKLENGQATWSFTAPKAATAKVEIRNESGDVVFAGEKALTAGTNEYVWNGKTSDGNTAPAGTYSLVVDAKDSAGNAVRITQEITGRVDGLDFTNGDPNLLVNGMSVSLWSVKKVRPSV